MTYFFMTKSIVLASKTALLVEGTEGYGMKERKKALTERVCASAPFLPCQPNQPIEFTYLPFVWK